MYSFVKFMCSEKATKFCEISTLLLSYVVPVKGKVEILQNFVAFSEYMNFTRKDINFKLEILKNQVDHNSVKLICFVLCLYFEKIW